MNKDRIIQTVFGVSLGVAVGLLFDSMLLLLTSGWLVVFIFPVVVPVIITAVYFGRLGWKGKFSKISWLRIVLVIIIGWPLCLLGPIWIREAGFRIRINVVTPKYPDSKILSTNIVAVAGDGSPWMGMKIKIHDNFQEIVDFYIRELTNRGWEIEKRKIGVSTRRASYNDAYMITAKKSKQYLSISILKDSLEEQSCLVDIHYETKDILYIGI